MKALRHPISENKNFEVDIFCSYVQTCDSCFGPGASYERKKKKKNVIKAHYYMLHAKYQSSRPSSFRDEEF